MINANNILFCKQDFVDHSIKQCATTLHLKIFENTLISPSDLAALSFKI